MKIEINSNNYTVSEKLKDLIERKVSKLDKYFNDDAVAKVNCKMEGNTAKLELSVRSRGLFYRAEVSSDNMYDNVDLALPKVERQIVKYGDKFIARLKKDGVKKIKFLCVIASPVGIKAIQDKYDDVEIYCASVDRCLNDVAYILPGLGDAGDRVYGTK